MKSKKLKPEENFESWKKIKIEIEYSTQVDKFFSKYPEIKKMFIENLKLFYVSEKEHGKKVDIKILKGISPKQYRMRIGDYRVIFNITKKKFKVYSIFVKKAGFRGDVYK
jgi:hypothetical protein